MLIILYIALVKLTLLIELDKIFRVMSEKDKAIIGKNLKFLRRKSGLTQQELANELEIRRSSIGAYEECRASPRYETLERISNFFDVSIDLLVKEDLSLMSPEALREEQEQRKMDIEGKRLRILPVSIDDKGRELIEFVSSQKASAGYLNGLADPEYIEELPKFHLPMLNEGTYRSFEITGDSMLPLKPGTIIIGEYVDNWKNVKDGETYVIVSDSEGIVYKRVYNRIEDDGGFLILRSDNQLYSTYEVDIKDVREIWKAKMYISSEFPEPEMTLEKLSTIVLDIQQEVIKLKEPRR